MSNQYYGPTVYEAALQKIRACNNRIAELQANIVSAKRRADIYKGSSTLESERIATGAEPLQRVQLPE